MKYKLEQTKEFKTWINRVKDKASRARILRRLDSIEMGNFGDHKHIADGLFELRIFFGPGFRVYYMITNNIVVVILAGGNKSSQERDIAKAKKLMKERGKNDAKNNTI